MRYSKQRELVLNTVKSVKTHPTAEVVYQLARETQPNISLGTVYRNLKSLTDSGDIITVETEDKLLHYDGDLSEHMHFVCSKCGEIFDYFIKTKIPKEVADSGMVVCKSKTVYYGICKNCLKKEN